MQSDSDDQTPAEPAAATAGDAASRKAEAYRERFRKSQAIAAQIARARAAGGQPDETEAARLVAEFHARGGQVTVYPEAEEPPPGEQDRKTGRARTS